jgi:hypothetical protein
MGPSRLLLFSSGAVSQFLRLDGRVLREEFSLQTRRNNAGMAFRAVQLTCHKMPVLTSELQRERTLTIVSVVCSDEAGVCLRA